MIAALRYRRAVERVHRLGVRPVAELLIEAGVPLADVERVARFDQLPPAWLDAINISAWAPDLFAVPSS